MHELEVINKYEVSTINDKTLKSVWLNIKPAVEKKCREIDKELKTRVQKNGSCDGIKQYTEKAGVDITDIEGFYKEYASHITKDEFIANCVNINMAGLKKLVIDRIQKQILIEKGEQKSKKDIESEINGTALRYGTEKKKKVYM